MYGSKATAFLMVKVGSNTSARVLRIPEGTLPNVISVAAVDE